MYIKSTYNYNEKNNNNNRIVQSKRRLHFQWKRLYNASRIETHRLQKSL